MDRFGHEHSWRTYGAQSTATVPSWEGRASRKKEAVQQNLIEPYSQDPHLIGLGSGVRLGDDNLLGVVLDGIEWSEFMALLLLLITKSTSICFFCCAPSVFRAMVSTTQRWTDLHSLLLFINKKMNVGVLVL